MAYSLWILVSYLLAIATADSVADDEKAAYSVTVVVYMLPITKWHSGCEEKFRNTIATTAERYCTDHAQSCYLQDHWQNGGSFEESDISLSSDFLSYRKPYFTTRFSLSLPTGVANTAEYLHDESPSKFYVHSTVLEDITVHAVSHFANVSGYYIIGVNDVEFSIPPNHMMNLALTLASFVILGLCLASCLLLNWKCGGEPDRVTHSDSEDDEATPMQKKPIVEMEAIGFNKPSGMEAASMVKTAQKVNGSNETKA